MMGEINFFKSLFFDEKDLPGKQLIKNFNKAFLHAKNAEWHPKNDNFEVIFYENDVEKIAEFDKEGKLILLKTNLKPLTFQGKLREIAEKYGEIMNTIKIEREGKIQFELIVRDKELKRYLLILDEFGTAIKFEQL